MNGGPSHVDTFDPKPMLTKYHGKPVPTNLPTERKTGAAFRSPFTFKKYGQSGIEVSEIFARTGEMIDDICVVRSMHADVPNHEPSLMLMNCGEARQARPSFGSWVLYGLGTENQNLPGFIVMCPGGYPDRRVAELAVGVPARHLPGNVCRYPAHRHREADRPHPQPRRQPPAAAGPARPPGRAQPRAPRSSDSTRPSSRRGSSRSSWPTACNRRRPTPSTSAASRLTSGRCTGRACTPDSSWPRGGCSSAACGSSSSGTAQGSPGTITTTSRSGHRELGRQCDQAIAAFLKDLKQRGMLDDTLVIWGGEFGRTPTVELPTPGRQRRQDERPRPQPLRLHDVAGRRRRQGRPRPRRHRRTRLPGRREQGPRPRPPRHDPAPARLQPRDSSPSATPAATSA